MATKKNATKQITICILSYFEPLIIKNLNQNITEEELIKIIMRKTKTSQKRLTEIINKLDPKAKTEGIGIEELLEMLSLRIAATQHDLESCKRENGYLRNM